jgi:hypothetical protein
MPWEFLVIPIIAVAVWIISVMVRNTEEAKKPDRASPRKPEKVTDLDRFLREVQRRKQASEREEERPARAERRRESPRRAMPREEEEIPVALPVDEVPTVEPVSVAPVMRIYEAPPLPSTLAPPVLRVHEAPPLPDMPVDTSAKSLPQAADSAAMVGLRELLQTRQGLRKAMILQEVLGLPVSRRGRAR